MIKLYIEENPNLKINKAKIDEILKNVNGVEIVAATKYISEPAMKDLFEAGITSFGENRVEPFIRKHNNLKDLGARWHFIGHLQRNKANKIINDIDVLHSLDSLELAKIINNKRELPLDCYIELKLVDNPNKDGVLENDLESFINEIKNNYKKINIIGLMAMSEPDMTDDMKKDLFKRVKAIGLKYNLHQFSMGMSDDYIDAIEAGSTCIRLGRILYNM